MKQNKNVVETYVLDEKTMVKESLTKFERAITRVVFFFIVYAIITMVWRFVEFLVYGTVVPNSVDTIVASIFSCHFVLSHKTEAYKWVIKHIKKDS